MKAFLVGFIFFILTSVLLSMAFLLYPLLLVFVFFLRIIFVAIFTLCAIWLLGKAIIYMWEKIK